MLNLPKKDACLFKKVLTNPYSKEAAVILYSHNIKPVFTDHILETIHDSTSKSAGNQFYK